MAEAGWRAATPCWYVVGPRAIISTGIHLAFEVLQSCKIMDYLKRDLSAYSNLKDMGGKLPLTGFLEWRKVAVRSNSYD